MNRLKNILLLIIFLIGYIILFKLNLKCLWNELFNVTCISCGMTRAFICILNFDIIRSFSYNVLALPLFIIIVISVITIVYDIVYNKNTFINNITKILNKYYILIFICIIVGYIINIILK